MVMKFTLSNFTKGLNVHDHPADIDDKEFSELNNCIIDNGVINNMNTPSISTLFLPGNFSKVHGLFEYIDSEGLNTGTVLLANDTGIEGRYITGPSSYDTIAAGLHPTNDVFFEKFNDGRVYFVDGSSPLKSIYANGSSVTASVATIADELSEYIFYKSGSDYYCYGYHIVRKKLERWKWNGSAYVYDIDISTVVADNYQGLAYNATTGIFFAFNYTTKCVEGWNSSATRTINITTALTTLYGATRASIDEVNGIYYLLCGRSASTFSIASVNIGTGIITNLITSAPSSGLRSIYYYSGNVYYTELGIIKYINISTSVINTLQEGDIVSVSGTSIYVFKQSSGILYVSIYNSSYVLTSYYTISISGSLYYINLGVNIISSIAIYMQTPNSLYFASTTSIPNTTVRQYDEVSEITGTLTVAGTTGASFRSGLWYFAYRILRFESSDERMSNLIGETTYYQSTASGLTFTPSVSKNPTDVYIIYARHETEIAYYEVGRTLSTSLSVTTELSPLYFYEERDTYNPPPSGCTMLINHRDMMWYVKGDTLYISNYNQPLNIPRIIVTETGDYMGGVFTVGQDKVKINAIYVFRGFLFLIKDNKDIYRISGDPGDLSSFRIDRIGIIGCKNQRCICDDGKRVFTYDGQIWIFDENGVSSESISEKIEGTDGINSSTLPLRTYLCYHRSTNRLLLTVNSQTILSSSRVYNNSTWYVLNLKNNTWSTATLRPGGIPINIKYLGVKDLYIEDGALYDPFYSKHGIGGVDMSFTTKRFNKPSPSLYKRFNLVDVINDGETGISFSNTDGVNKSKVYINGTLQNDNTTVVYPGGTSIRQRIKNRTQKGFNYSVRIIASIAVANAKNHSISSITFEVNEKGGSR